MNTMETLDRALAWLAAEQAGQINLTPSARPPAVPTAPLPRPGLDTSDLDIIAYFTHHESYGRLVSEEQGISTVLCPWEDQHSSEADGTNTDTIIYDGRDGRLPGFRCMHSHCVGRRLQEVMGLWIDAEAFGARRRTGGSYDLTDEGNVSRLIDRYGGHLRYCHEFGGWLAWAGRGRWEMAGNGCDVYEFIRDTINQLTNEANQTGDGTRRNDLLSHYIKSQKWERMTAIYKSAATKRDVRARSSQFDADAFLLNCPNGCVDLRTGEHHANQPDHYCTRQTAVPYDPTATCPRFDQFLSEVFGGDDTLVEFLWRAIGYSLTGSVKEQVLFFLYGSGSNGKSTLLDVLRRLLGDYATVAAPGLLLEAKSDRHPTEIADLRGRRLVYCVETGEGKRMAEELVKRLTGGDLIKARFMRADFFHFLPTHKLWLSANHKPVIRGGDHAIWRRIPVIPFTVQFKDADQAAPGEPIKDTNLLEKLHGELSGILAKAVRFAQEWNVSGLPWPDRVRAEVGEYRDEMDVMGVFIEDRCELKEDARENASDLYREYRAWCDEVGEFTFSQRRFSLALQERGFEKSKVSTVAYKGLRLLSLSERTVRAA